MGPRIEITGPEFERIAQRHPGLVIRSPKSFGHSAYLIRAQDYYYYTIVKTPLNLPETCEVLDARQIML